MAELEQYCILARAQKGRACAALVQQVLSHRKIFVFGELLAIPSVKSLADSEFSKEHCSLQLFAYGTYQDYASNPSSYLDLTDAQITKLRQLTLLSLAAQSRVLPYPTMLAALGIASVRELEDLLIDTVYSGLMEGKIDQMRASFRVGRVSGRDVRVEALPTMQQQLAAWKAKIQTLNQALQNCSAILDDGASANEAEQHCVQRSVDAQRVSVREQIEMGVDSGDIEDAVRGRQPPSLMSRLKMPRGTMGVRASGEL